MNRTTILAGVLSAVTLGACSGPASVSPEEIEQLRTQARRAQDVGEIQNLMSRRAMYHSIGQNERELELWSKDQEIRWAQNQGCWIGRDNIEAYYVTNNYTQQRAALERISQSNPAIENDFARNRYIGSSVYHLLTTPIIEVAGDGQSAKAFWYTPGVILASEDGLTARGTHMWERYYVDLVREQGQWRFLHIEVLTDFSSQFGQPLSWAGMEATMGSEGAAPGQQPPPGGAPPPGSGPPPGSAPPGRDDLGPSMPAERCETFSPTRVPTLGPRLPEPYTTFGETFEYADCNQ